jgi:hypothetical protein
MFYQSLVSDSWVHAHISVYNICTLIRRADKANRAGGREIMCFAGKSLRKISV